MEPKPVQGNDQPRYPTRREVLAGAASFALVNLAGCSFAVAEPESGKVNVAPIFEHGEGRGVTGCVVVSPPVFLSEEQGMQILREELSKHGIQLTAGGTLEGVRVPARIAKYDKGKKSVVEVPDRAKPLKSSGMDSDRRVAVEFVSHEDYFDLGGPRSGSTVQVYEFKEVAEHLAGQVKKQGKDRVFLGMFYDPSPKLPRVEPPKQDGKVDWETAWKKRMEQGKEESKKLLRLQAQDFVKWLKEQKAVQ